jgi:hypothetical protein
MLMFSSLLGLLGRVRQGWGGRVVAFIDRMVGQLRGRNIAILGERETGKTHLHYFLRTRTIPAQYTQTLGQERVRASVAKLIVVGASGDPEKVVLRLHRGYDVPGSAEAIDSWRAVLERAAIMLYLFRADYVFYQDEWHLKRIREDAEALAGILRRSPQRPSAAALVGTHYDCVPGFQGPEQGNAFYKWHTLMEEKPEISQARQVLAAQLPQKPALVVGSMKTLPQTQELLYRLFSQELKIGR